jgi:hypothetical protein
MVEGGWPAPPSIRHSLFAIRSPVLFSFMKSRLFWPKRRYPDAAPRFPPVVLAKAIQFSSQDALIFANAGILRRDWIPAFAGMNGGDKFLMPMPAAASR